ncbi:MAG: DUF4440 domain-containing protein [Cyanobacteria bacterium J06600_6]
MSSSDREEIRKVFEEVYADNVKTKNILGYGEMYTEDALWIPPNASDRCGREDIITGFCTQISRQSIDPVFVADEIEVTGDSGYVIGTSLATIYPDDGSPSKQVKFGALWLMKKVQGVWKIDRQIWNNKSI